jgi:phage gp36-like protein
MAYFLNARDYAQLIKSDKLDTVISGDTAILRQAEMSAQSEMESYLMQRYKTSLVFSPVYDYDENITFTFLSRIFLNAPSYNFGVSYPVDTFISFQDKVYKANTTTSTGNFDPLEWDLIGDEAFYYLDAPLWGTGNTYQIGEVVKIERTYYIATQVNQNIRPNGANGATAWGEIAGLNGEIPVSSPYWIKGDSRPAHIVMRLIDLTLYHLHSRINPRNIPEFRIARRDEAIEWLKMIAKGSITTDLPLVLPEQGSNIVWGSQPKRNVFY